MVIAASSAALASAGSTGRAASAPIVSGDLIVKFRDATEPGRDLAAVLGGQRTVASMAPLATRLSGELGVPLVLMQVTSGREALLALDRPALTRTLVARASQQAAVRSATADGPAAGVGLPSAELALRLELRDAAPAADLAARLAPEGLPAPRLQRLAGTPRSAHSWRAHYDIDALTLALIAKLQQRPDVEYVQPNRLLHPAGGTR